MGQLDDAFRDAADEVAQIKAQPSNRYWWLYGTIKAKNSNGTLNVAIDGVTIQQVKATVSCMMASVGDRVIVLKAGPLMTCVDVIATSDNAVVPAASLPTASATAKGIMQVGSGLTVLDGIVSVDNAPYVKNIGIWDVIQIGKLCVCSCVWTAPNNAYITSKWGSFYESTEHFTPPDYPVQFESIPSSHVSYVLADTGSYFVAFVERDPDTTTKNIGRLWLCRPNSGTTISHPRFAILAVGKVN